MPWLEHSNFDPYICMELCKTNGMEMQDYLQRVTNLSFPKYTNPPAWTPKHRVTSDYATLFSWWTTVFLRVNCANALLEYIEQPNHPVIRQFINAHVPIIRHIDAMDSRPMDHFIDTLLYQSPGKCHDDRTRNSIKVKTTEHWRETPLKTLRRAYPNLKWTLEELNHETVLEKCQFLTRQCKDLHKKEANAKVRDALWFYHGCFIDYFYNLPQNNQMPLELYPFDTRCFTAYDLPSCFHVLSSIPMWGEQSTPNFTLGKFIQKSLPFAGARRTLINQTDKHLALDEAFFRVFRSIFYCMMLDMYPEHLSDRKRCFDMDKLLRAKQLSSDRDLLRTALSMGKEISQKEMDKGCFVVFTAFRMWMVLMADNQEHFQSAVPIDWQAFADETIEMAKIIRQTNLFARDPFAQARLLLSKNNKNPKNNVYRYRKTGVIDTLLEKMTDTLEKDLYKQAERWKSQHIHAPLVAVIEKELNVRTKENIMNALIRIPQKDWLTPKSYCILLVPEFGGVRKETLDLLASFIEIYYNSSRPKDYSNLLNQFHIPDFKILCWYFHVISLLGRIDFAPLTMDQVLQIDQAKEKQLFPGQRLEPHAFTVYFTLCCGKIKTLQNQGNLGHADIAYDQNRHLLVCSKASKKTIELDSDEMAFSEVESQRKNARKQRKDFNYIPCHGNPVLPIVLRGFMLVYNGNTRFMHCVECGVFHQAHYENQYRCGQCCKRNDYTTCTVCGMPGSTEQGQVIDPLEAGVFKQVFFCKRHFNSSSAD